jgi:hypothetical protein
MKKQSLTLELEGRFSDITSLSIKKMQGIEGDRVSGSEPVSRVNQYQARLRSPQPRLGRAPASKAERPFGLVQVAVSGVVLLRSYILVVEGDSYAPRVRVSARWFLWGAIVGLSHKASKSNTRR